MASTKKQTKENNDTLTVSSPEVKEKTFMILDFEKKNKNHRTYPFEGVVEKWLEDERLKNEGGLPIEHAIEDIDLEYEFIKESLECGSVVDLRVEKNKLYATAKFKVNHPLTEQLYKDQKFFDTLTLVPKGKGAIKNQIVQDDYELYGFNLVLAAESAFAEEEAPVKAEK